MSLRRLYILILVAFAVALAASSGWLASFATSRALEDELDAKLLAVAGAAAEAGLQSSSVLVLQPGDEDAIAWTSNHARLQRLRRFVAGAWIFRRDRTALVSTEPADSLPIGAPLRWLDAYDPELDELWAIGEATTPLFAGEDGRFYKYGFVRLEQSEVGLAVLMRADYLEPLARFQRTVLIGSGLAIVLAAILAAGLAARIVEPLERLSRVALRIQRGRMNNAVEVEPGEELGRLSRAMERMRQGIVQRDEQFQLMLAQVAHEIRNPLGGVELFASAAAESTDSEERGRLLSRIRSEVDVLNDIISDFLVYARPRPPEVNLHDIRHPIREAADLVAAEMESVGGSLEVDLPVDELEAMADPYQVKRLVLNLLRNASDAGDRVWVRGEWLNGEVIISVRDNGPGVPEEMRGRIFEPFITNKEKGAGLGLAIVKGVAKANGARVELADNDESPGSGAEFRLYFSGSEEFPIAGVEPAVS